MKGESKFVLMPKQHAVKEYSRKRVLKFHIFLTMSQGSSVSIAIGYGLDDQGFWGSIPGGSWEFFLSQQCPDWLWGPPSLLCNG
jgi:hypothetical protein